MVMFGFLHSALETRTRMNAVVQSQITALNATHAVICARGESAGEFVRWFRQTTNRRMLNRSSALLPHVSIAP